MTNCACSAIFYFRTLNVETCFYVVPIDAVSLSSNEHSTFLIKQRIVCDSIKIQSVIQFCLLCALSFLILSMVYTVEVGIDATSSLFTFSDRQLSFSTELDLELSGTNLTRRRNPFLFSSVIKLSRGL